MSLSRKGVEFGGFVESVDVVIESTPMWSEHILCHEGYGGLSGRTGAGSVQPSLNRRFETRNVVLFESVSCGGPTSAQTVDIVRVVQVRKTTSVAHTVLPHRCVAGSPTERRRVDLVLSAGFQP